MLCCIDWKRLTDVSDVLTVSIIKVMRIMQAVNTSETSVNFYQTTWNNIPETGHLHLALEANTHKHTNMHKDMIPFVNNLSTNENKIMV
jgi:hypothetical protein